MHMVQAILATNVASASAVGMCVLGVCFLGVGFMLWFLRALMKERKAAVVGHRLEYWFDDSPPEIASAQTWHKVSTKLPSGALQAIPRDYDRGEFATGLPRTLADAKLTFAYRFSNSSRQESGQARLLGPTIIP